MLLSGRSRFRLVLLATALLAGAAPGAWAQQSGSSPARPTGWVGAIYGKVARSASRNPPSAGGRVRLAFVVAKDGALVSFSVISATNAKSAAAGLRAVREAAPFPPMPAAFAREQQRFEVPIRFH